MITLLLLGTLALIFHQAASKNNVDLAQPLPLSEGFKISGGASGDYLGISVGYAGDVNNDGIADIVVGAYKADSPGRADAGIVYVIFGQETAMAANLDLSNTLPLSQGFLIRGVAYGDGIGSWVNYAGDVNNDGIDDFIIGGNSVDRPGNSNCGAAYIIYGKPNGQNVNIDLSLGLSPSQGFWIKGALANDRVGSSAGYAGDVNKDGFDDVIVGAYGIDFPSLTDAGAAYIIYGKPTGLASNIDLTTPLSLYQGFMIKGGVASGALGYAVGYAGDINKDGISDVIVGSYLANSPQFTGAGIVTVIYGKAGGMTSHIDLSTTLPLSQGFQIFGGAQSDRLGRSVSTAGDINKDGIADIILGADRTDRPGASDTGTAYIIYGIAGGMTSNIYLSNPLPLSQGFRIDGAAQNDHVGVSVNYVGDVNQDGIDDIIVGSDQSAGSASGSGAAYVIYGRENGMTANIDLSTPLLLSQGIKISGEVPGDGLGAFACRAGDFNHDGIDDIIVGALTAHPFGRTTAGAAYVIYDPPYCSTIECVVCSNSKCLACATDFLLYIADGKCYTQDTCPSGTTPNATHCVDTRMESLRKIQVAVSWGATLTAWAVTLVDFSNPLPLLFTALADTLLYMKYMSIKYPPRLQYLLDLSDSPLLSIPDISSPPEEFIDYLPKHLLPYNFEKYDMDSSFLLNFWPSITHLLIIVSAMAIVCLSAWLTRNCKFIHSKLEKAKESLKWNYLLATFAGCYGDIAFFSSFELRTFQPDFFLQKLSFVTCVIMNIVLLVISVKIFTIIRKIMQQKKNSKSKLEKLKEELSDYQVVFEEFNTNSVSQQSFFLLACLRLYLFYTILAYLFEYPLVQAIIINAQSLALILYFLTSRPFESKFELFMSVLFEAIAEAVHCCVLGFAILNHQDPEAPAKATKLGDTLIICICIFIVANAAYLLIQILKNIVELVRKALCLKSKHMQTQNIRNRQRALNIYGSASMINDNQDMERAGSPKKSNPLTGKKLIMPPPLAAIPRRPGNQISTFTQLVKENFDGENQGRNRSPSPSFRRIAMLERKCQKPGAAKMSDNGNKR